MDARGGWVVGGGLGKVGWVVSVWVRSVGLSWAGFVELSSVGWVQESGVRGHHNSRRPHAVKLAYSIRVSVVIAVLPNIAFAGV